MDLDLKFLFTRWLEERFDELMKKGSKVAHAYTRASEKIRAFPGPIETPKQLSKIQYVGVKLVKFLCARLKRHCKENGITIPVEFENYVGDTEGGKRQHELDPETENKKKKTAQNWVPKRRGGSWAILITLCTADKQRRGLRRDDIVAVAEKYCDKSFTANPAARDYYSAWDGVKTLLKRGLVEEFGRPKAYVITEEGSKMAEVLIRQEGIASSPARAPETSFDNGVRVSPGSSAFNSSVLAPRDQVSSPLKRRNYHNNSLFMNPVSSDVEVNEETNKTDREDRSEKPPVILDDDALGSDPEVHDENVPLPASQSVTARYAAKSPEKKANPLKGKHDAANKTYSGTQYDVWAPADYEVVLILDNREIRSKGERDFFYNKIVGRGVTCDVRALSVGDVLWIARHKQTKKEVVLNYVCERKRIDDLAGSIKDGRFAEQKSRLKKSGIKNVHYIVEESGLVDIPRVADMKQSLETAISMVITMSNFYMQRFRRTDDTIDWLVLMTEVLQEKHQNVRLLVLKPKSVRTQDEYLEYLLEFRQKFESRKTPYECVHSFPMYQESLVKSNMMTVKEMFVKMLMSVRGISFEKAIMIQRYFGTPRNLIEFYIEKEGFTETAKGDLIMDIFKDEVGPKKIGKAASVAMYEAWGKPVC
ncbi:hypothetical protein OXX69_002477 [Metschnikowia pulcherrima]